jgi:hypothetical protein
MRNAVRFIQRSSPYLFGLLTTLGCAISVSAQPVHSVRYASQADVKVFVAQYVSQADLLVHKVKYRSQASGNDGLWFFTEYGNQASKTIFFVDYPSQADLKVKFVDYPSQAGWRDVSKKHLLY